MMGRRCDVCVCFGGYCYRGLCHQKKPKPAEKRAPLPIVKREPKEKQK